MKAKKEVIISCGSVNTPQILELSGIGANNLLDEVGIKQIVGLPSWCALLQCTPVTVLIYICLQGENLQDHILTMSVWERKDNDVTRDVLDYNTSFAQQQQELYATNANDPASILTEIILSITYVSLSTLVGKSAAEDLVSEAAAYADASTAPYKKPLQQQIAFLKQYPEIVIHCSG